MNARDFYKTTKPHLQMASPTSLLLLSDYVPGILRALQKEHYKQFFNLEVASTREKMRIPDGI